MVACEPAKACGPSDTTLDHPAARQQYKASFCFGVLDHQKLDAMLLWLNCGGFARIALIDKGNLNGIPGLFLDCLGQPIHLCPVLFTGWGDMQGEQMTQRIDCQMDFGSATPFGAIIACTCSTLLRRSQRAAIHDRGSRCRTHSTIL